MQQDMAIATLKYFAISSSGTLAAAASLGAQLNTPHVYLSLHLPYWVFLVSMVVLNFCGAFFALRIDYMQDSGSKVGNFFTAVLVGLILSFVVIPTISPSVGVGLMQIASFISGLCGTILLRVVINILNRQDLQQAIADLIVNNAIKATQVAADVLAKHTSKVVTALITTVIASFIVVPSISDKIDTNSELPAQITEVQDD